nr:PREDICTED: uncharacterized protein LOC105663929 [Megachile rotundata]XP_012151539.1 PREDICTED: uncharacterized protein LOC105663929 [Megachile rotundata]
MRYGLFRGSCEKKEDSPKMTNACVTSALRSQSTAMNSIEDAIEKIRRLRVTADDEDAARPDPAIDRPIDHDKRDEGDEKETEEEKEEKDDSDGSDEDDENSDESDDLVERGPMKQYSPPTRARPYHVNSERRFFFDLHESVLLDYDKSVEEILRDEDLLSTNELNRNRLASQENESISLSDTNVDDSAGNRLLEDVLRGVFQAAQPAAAKENDDARSFWENHESSYLTESHAPAARTVSDSSSDTLPPAPNSRIVPSMYREPQSSCYSYSSSSCSSNQSFGDAASPKSYQALVGPRIETRRIEEQDLDDCSFWKEQELESVKSSAISAILKELVNGLEEETGVRTEETRGSDSTAVTGGFGPIGESTNLPSFAEVKRSNPIVADFSSCLSEISYSDLVPVLDSLPNFSPSPNTIHTDRPNSKELEKTVESTGAIDDSRIPKVLASFESRPQQNRNKSEQNASPWSSLNMPMIPASDKLKEQLDATEVKNAMIDLLKWKVEELARQDRDGDTALMCLVGNLDEFLRKKAYLVPLVERLNTMKGAIAITNRRGEDALYLAALNFPQFPYVTGYLAAVMLQKNIDIAQRLYRISGDTLIHAVAAQGDSHAEVLAELLSLKTSQGHAVFDLSKRNYDGKTALHVAVESHNPVYGGTWSLASVKLLLKYGADPRTKETRSGDTSLHVAVSRTCDPALVKVLLEARGSESVNAINYDHDTPLHAAAAASNVPLSRQTEICWLLIRAGGNTNLPNIRGEVPLDLAPSDRREAIAKIFYAMP